MIKGNLFEKKFSKNISLSQAMILDVTAWLFYNGFLTVRLLLVTIAEDIEESA